MDFLYNKLAKYFKRIFKNNDDILNIVIASDGYDTLVTQGKFLNKHFSG